MNRGLVITSWDPELALAIRSADVRELRAQAAWRTDRDLLRSLPDEPYVVTAGEDVNILWLGPHMLAIVAVDAR